MSISGKKAVVTGGNSGIGYATAKELIAQGAAVIITGRRKEAIERAAAELGAIPFLADQSIVGDTERLVSEVAARFGKVDILFINAGVAGVMPLEETTEAFFDNMMGINFRGAYFMLSRFVPLLAEGSSVVFLSSNTPHMSAPGSAIYAASKAALNTVMRTAAMELAPGKVRVNAVSPGPTRTEVLKKMGLGEAMVTVIEEKLIDVVPLHTMGKAEDVASMIAWLCGDAATFVTGAEFLMDGGMSLVGPVIR